MEYFNSELETLSRSKLRKLQNERLQRQLKRLYGRVAFYKNLFDENGIDPKEIKGVEDLHKIPFTKKGALRDNYPFGLFASPMEDVVRLHCSSGTTGKPIVVGYTKNDIDVFSEVVARSLVAAGCRRGMKLQNAYGYGLFTGGLGLHYGAEKLGMTVIPISGGGTEKQLLLLQDFQSEAICCTPSYAMTIAEAAQRQSILDKINLRYAILGAEPWTESIRAEVESKLNVKATNIYGLSEIIGPGVSQEDVDEPGSGSYVWEDHFFPEIVDKDSGEPLPEGKEGVLVFTTLTKEAMPLLRYWTNDITSIYYDKNAKRTHVKMGPIIGRSDDMLIIRGVNLFPSQIEAVLNDLPEFSSHYRLEISKEGSMDQVDIHIELSEKIYKDLNTEIIVQKDLEILKSLHQKLSQKIKDNIGLTMKITLENYQSVPRSEGGKLNRVVDRRAK